MSVFRFLFAGVVPAAAIESGGCRGNTEIFVDTSLFEDPSQASAGVLGNSEDGRKLVF